MQPPLDVPAFKPKVSVTSFSVSPVLTMEKGTLKIGVLFPPLMLGGTLHLILQDLTTDPNGLAAYFAREGIDCLMIVPSHFSAMLSAASGSLFTRRITHEQNVH